MMPNQGSEFGSGAGQLASEPHLQPELIHGTLCSSNVLLTARFSCQASSGSSLQLSPQLQFAIFAGD